MIKPTRAFLETLRRHMFKGSEPMSSVSAPSDFGPVVLFFLTVFFYITHQLVMQPGWVLGGEMWAEMATNYFSNANSPSYFQKLFSTDAGYIPAPQRLIALAGNVFNLPASSIPYFYTWSAILLTGMMMGAFCLAQFRTLVKNDGLRFFTAIAVLFVADFYTRTFISFTYFAAYFAAIVTALALVDDCEDVPWWAWFIPIWMVSKPAVLAALPAMIVVAVVSKSRFRRITVATVALCVGQIVQMVMSQKAGAWTQAHGISFLSKAINSFKYFFGFLGGYMFGPNSQLYKNVSTLAGLFICFASGFVLFKKRNNAGALVLVGFSLLFFNVLLNCFVLSDAWNGGMAPLADLPVDRHIIVGFFGCVLASAGLFASLTDGTFSKSKFLATINFGSLIFIVWFVGSGWLSFGGKISRDPGSPITKNSQWQNMALAIDSGASPLCVPIDPLGWIYSRNCTLFNPEIDWMNGVPHFEAARLINGLGVLDITPPASFSEKTLISLAVLVKPIAMQTLSVNVKAIINLKDGSRKYYAGGRDVPISGGLILLTGKESFPIKNISSVRFIFSSPVEIALTANDPNSHPAILWMGN